MVGPLQLSRLGGANRIFFQTVSRIQRFQNSHVTFLFFWRLESAKISTILTVLIVLYEVDDRESFQLVLGTEYNIQSTILSPEGANQPNTSGGKGAGSTSCVHGTGGPTKCPSFCFWPLRFDKEVML